MSHGIDSKDISVVIQGPVYGTPQDSYDKRYTLQCIDSVRKQLAGAEIILSTWEGSNVEGLNPDILLFSKDPGGIPTLYDGKPSSNSVLRVGLSSREGLRRATRRYALKMRSDVLITGDEFLKYFGLYNLRCDKYKILKQRALCLYPPNPKRGFRYPYSPSDWQYFGLTEDVLNIWDIPLMTEDKWKEKGENGYYERSKNLAAEQWVWVSFLRKYVTVNFDYLEDMQDNAIENSEISMVNNLVFLSAKQFCIKPLKQSILGGHATESPRRLVFYTHNEWKALYNKYCGGDLIIKHDPRDTIDLIPYWILVKFLLPFNLWLRTNFPGLHTKIRKMIKKAFKDSTVNSN